MVIEDVSVRMGCEMVIFDGPGEVPEQLTFANTRRSISLRSRPSMTIVIITPVNWHTSQSIFTSSAHSKALSQQLSHALLPSYPRRSNTFLQSAQWCYLIIPNLLVSLSFSTLYIGVIILPAQARSIAHCLRSWSNHVILLIHMLSTRQY